MSKENFFAQKWKNCFVDENGAKVKFANKANDLQVICEL